MCVCGYCDAKSLCGGVSLCQINIGCVVLQWSDILYIVFCVQFIYYIYGSAWLRTEAFCRESLVLTIWRKYKKQKVVVFSTEIAKCDSTTERTRFGHQAYILAERKCVGFVVKRTCFMKHTHLCLHRLTMEFTKQHCAACHVFDGR